MLEYSEYKFNTNEDIGRGNSTSSNNYRKNKDNLKSTIYCLKAKIHHFNVSNNNKNYRKTIMKPLTGTEKPLTFGLIT